MKINAILVDDEKKALESLQLKINQFFPEIKISDKFQNPEKAVDAINNTSPDILFLDVEMPVLSGFDVLSRLKNLDFQIIFVTAYSDYAIEAFKNCAIGYVLKPIDNDELQSTVQTALKNIRQKNNLAKNEALLSRLIETSSKANKLMIPTDKGLLFVPYHEILCFEGYDGYTKIHTIDALEIISSYNIGKYEKMLTDAFYKCHKSHIINLHKVRAFENEGYILLENKKRVPVSKSKRKEFIDLFST